MQPFGFVDDGLKDFLHHPRIQFAGGGPFLALRKHFPAMPGITDALAVVLELQRRKRIFLACGEQLDEIAINGIDRRAYVGEVTAGSR